MTGLGRFRIVRRSIRPTLVTRLWPFGPQDSLLPFFAEYPGMRGIATLLCALSLTVAASGCCGGCGPCGKGCPTASTGPGYNSGSTYAANDRAPTSADLGGTSPSAGGSSVAPASFESPIASEPSVEMEGDAPSDRTARRNLPSYNE